MTVQRKFSVSTRIEKRNSSPKALEANLAAMGDWVIGDFTIGYISTEVVIGKELHLMVGLTNLSALDLILNFKNGQRVRLVVTDANGTIVTQTPEDTSDRPSQEMIKATAGAHWTDSIQLDPKLFKAGSQYLVSAQFRSTNMPASLSLLISVQG